DQRERPPDTGEGAVSPWCCGLPSQLGVGLFLDVVGVGVDVGIAVGLVVGFGRRVGVGVFAGLVGLDGALALAEGSGQQSGGLGGVDRVLGVDVIGLGGRGSLDLGFRSLWRCVGGRLLGLAAAFGRLVIGGRGLLGVDYRLAFRGAEVVTDLALGVDALDVGGLVAVDDRLGGFRGGAVAGGAAGHGFVGRIFSSAFCRLGLGS